jgi:hypothetical protein
MLKVEIRGADEMLRDLRTVREKAIPYAARDACNTAAFETRKTWSEEIRKSFTTRNTFTAGAALRVDKARGSRIDSIVATVGSIADYMPKQESGAIIPGRSGHKGIPGPAAAGQAPGGKRTRPVRSANRMGAIKAFRVAKGATRHQRNAITLAMAKRKGQRFVVLERPHGGKGVFAVQGGKRKTTTRLLWDVSKRSVKVKPTPTLGPALKVTATSMPRIMEQSLLRQLRFHHCCGY